MVSMLTQFASTESGKADLFGALGIDWMALLIQMLAFLVLVWILAKFVYPVLSKSLEKREAAIEAAARAARDTEARTTEAQRQIEAMLRNARKEAHDIVATAHSEAETLAGDIEQKARAQSEQIITEAHASIDRQIEVARKTLHNETVELVALASKKVLGKTVDAKVDSQLVEAAVKEQQ